MKLYLVSLCNNKGDWNDMGDGSVFPLVVVSGASSPEEAIEAAEKAGHFAEEDRYRATASEMLVIAVTEE